MAVRETQGFGPWTKDGAHDPHIFQHANDGQELDTPRESLSGSLQHS